MTQDQFITTALTFPKDISIWYTPTSPYKILGIIIPIINADGQNILEYLLQSTDITVEIQNGIFANLQVSQGQILDATPTDQLYYLDVLPPYDITDVVNLPTFATQVSITSIVFSNTINQYVFNASGYNVLLNNVQDTRTSDYQYLGQTGILANIQDSLYSSTGWVNGRYEGSKTSQTNYVGISSTLSGKSFQGVYFPTTITDQQIKDQISAGAVTYTEYLYTGQEPLPTYTFIQDAYIIPAYISTESPTNTGTIPATATTIPMLLSASLSTPIPQVGDIVNVTSSLELMKIKQIDSYESNGGYETPLYKLTVERGYNYTTPQAIVTTIPTPPATNNPPVNLSTPSLIFKLQGNKVQGVQKGKVQVQTSGEILHIDRFGYIISGSN